MTNRAAAAAEHAGGDAGAPEPFGVQVARLRQQRGLSQGQLAHAALLSRTYVYHLETGQRHAPSVRVIRALMRALELRGDERRRFLAACARLTGQQLEDDLEGADLFDQRDLAALLVRNSAFPAHSLDRLWYIRSWNDPATQLFEADTNALNLHNRHLLAFVFDPAYRSRFRPWETLARRLLTDFKYYARTVTYLPEYRDLWRSLRTLPDFRRIADSSDPASGVAATFVFHMRHSQLGTLTLRTTVTVFSGASDHSIVTYVPGDQQTLDLFAANGWQANGAD
jgi:transcriptional regulator with XRE-family HTH domain